MKWKPARLTTAEFVAGLLIKIVLGTIYGYIYLHYYNGDDTWRLHRNSISETALLLSNPAAFFVNDLTPLHAFTDGEGWMEVARLYLVDLQYAILVKPLALLNLVTGANYYINSAVFNCLLFCGHYWLFAALTSLFPDKRTLYYYAVFLFLPAVFWLSGLRIDGLLFLFLSLFFYKLVARNTGSRLSIIVISFFGILICRPETAVLLIPATMAFLLSRRYSPIKSFVAVYGVSILLFFGTAWMSKGGGLPAAVAQKQHEFLTLGGTRFRLDRLGSDFPTYLKVFPQALLNTYIRPFLWEARGFLQFAAAFEVLLFWIMVTVIWLFRGNNWRRNLQHPAILFLFFVGVSVYISVGYLVPFPGAIIRYKAFALLFHVVVMCTLAKTQSYYNNKTY